MSRWEMRVLLNNAWMLGGGGGPDLREVRL